jgi:hypothetical protein
MKEAPLFHREPDSDVTGQPEQPAVRTNPAIDQQVANPGELLYGLAKLLPLPEDAAHQLAEEDPEQVAARRARGDWAVELSLVLDELLRLRTTHRDEVSTNASTRDLPPDWERMTRGQKISAQAELYWQEEVARRQQQIADTVNPYERQRLSMKLAQDQRRRERARLSSRNRRNPEVT